MNIRENLHENLLFDDILGIITNYVSITSLAWGHS